MVTLLGGGLGLCVLPGTAVGSSAAPAGWRLVYSDDFTGSAPGSVWGEYGGTYGIGANAWSPDEVSVSDGTLRVKMERKSSQGKPYTSGGVGTWKLAQTYGRYEFQAMAPTVAGIDSYVTLWPPDGDDSDATLVELLAKPATPPGQEAAYLTINYGGDKSEKTVPGSYCGAFHDYVIEWAPGYESISVDGRVLLKSPKSTSMKRWIGFVMSNGDTLTGTPSASAALPAEFDIRHLRVYAYSPGAPGSTASTSSPPASSQPSSKASAAASSATTATATPTRTTATTTPTGAFSPSAAAAGQPPAVTSTASASPSSGPLQPSSPPSPPSAPLSAEGAASTSHGGGIGLGPILLVAALGAAALVGVVFLSKRPQGARRRT
ncbi:MAG: glycoside hydrolase family 16 protein [Catenulispora sp.]|nr:glycoside hydrolase family 16 protein [Catenulispora sp.]